MMKKRLVCLSLVLIVASLGLTSAFAATPETDAAAPHEQKQPLGDAEKQQLQAKRAEMDAKWKQMQAKWEKLSAEQKAQVYALHDQQMQLQKQMIDEYVKLGVIDQATAAQMKSDIDAHSQRVKNGGMPFMHMGKGKCDRKDKD